MFAGHVAVALAAKPAAPRVSLGLLVAAAMWIDLVWPLFLLAGIERVAIDPGNTAFTPLDFVHYPWTLRLVAALGWSVAAAAGASVVVRRTAERVLVGALVFSHWVLDAVTHRPDLPLWPGDAPKVGLGLWNSIPATIAVEGALTAAGLWLYARATRPRDAVGRYGFWAFAATVVLVWLGNLAGPPPPDERSLALVALALWLLPAWAWWADRHREPLAPARM